MNETLDKTQPLPWWRRILLGLVLAAMAVLFVAMLASYLAERLLGAEIVKISRAGEPLTFADLENDFTQSTSAENATDYYVKALRAIHPRSLPNLLSVNNYYLEKLSLTSKNQFPLEVSKTVHEHLSIFQAVLENVDKAANLPLSKFDIGIKHGKQICGVRMQGIETIATLLSLRTLDLILYDKDDAAVNSLISMLKIMRLFDLHPTLELNIPRVKHLALVCGNLQLVLEHTKPLEKSLAKLQEVLSEVIRPDALERTFLAERVYQIKIANNFLPKKIKLQLLQDNGPDLPEQLPVPGSHLGRLRIRQKAIQYLHNMDRLITIARQPWPKPLDTMVSDVKKPDSLLASGLTFTRLIAKTTALARCSTLIVAIERYRKPHGEPPTSLDEVLGDYIDSIPLDPFTGKDLLYLYNKEGYTVYSVDVNCQDNGGDVEPGDNKKTTLDLGFRINFHKFQ